MQPEPGSEAELKRNHQRLFNATHCPVCGRPMVHYRLRGYRCHDERHNEDVDRAGGAEAWLDAHRPGWENL